MGRDVVPGEPQSEHSVAGLEMQPSVEPLRGRGRQRGSDRAIPGALVIGGDHQGLGIVRSLGRHGIPVWVLDDEVSISRLSRFTRRALRWPREASEQVDWLLHLGSTCDLAGWLLFPTRDETVELLAGNHARLASIYRVTSPPADITRWSSNKAHTYQLARDLQIPHPRTSIAPPDQLDGVD